MASISKLDKQDRPREKIKRKGAQALSDFELLQALIGSGNKQADVSKIAKDVKRMLAKSGASITYEELEQVTGLGSAKITEILAAFELSRRYILQSDQPIVDSPQKAAEQFIELRNKKQEYLMTITLDGANRLIAKRTITIGTLTSSLVHPREVFADAITDRAASIIVAHNHPSNDLTASKADIEVTKRLNETGKLLGIDMIDHLIIGKDDHKSIDFLQ